MKAARVLVAGMVAGVPAQGGATWAVIQFVLGLRALGCDVYFVEPVPKDALQPEGATLAGSRNARYFRDVMRRFDLLEFSALLLAGTRETVGLSYEVLRDVARGTDVLLNISGLLSDDQLTTGIGRRVYIDLDPAFNQLWHVVEGIDRGFEGHTHFVTVGQSIGKPGCAVPTGGRTWIPMLPPVVLDRWTVSEGLEHDALTTVGNWRGYGSIEVDGVLYGQKAHSLRELMHLPTLTDRPFLLAMAIHPDEEPDLRALSENGWRLVDPALVAGSPRAYGRFIRGSWAEIGIAKSGYVRSRCGWFSDRSACYLASGRPVVAQDTGLDGHLPLGEGLMVFSTEEEAASAIESVAADYGRHRRAARAIAEDLLRSDLVLGGLLDRVRSGS
jgi:hypothetical protein